MFGDFFDLVGCYCGYLVCYVDVVGFGVGWVNAFDLVG